MNQIKITKQQTATILTLQVEQDPKSLKLAHWLQMILSLIYKIALPTLIIIHFTGYDLQSRIESTKDYTKIIPQNEKLNQIVLLLVLGAFSFLGQLMLKNIITKQEVVVIQNLGVQLYSYNLKGQRCGSTFIDIARVRDVVINESMHYYKLDEYVAFICERESKLIVPFNNFRVAHKDLIGIYVTIKKFLDNYK